MRFYPTKIRLTFLCFVLTSILIVLGCNKDSDLLRDTVIEDSISSVEEREVNETEEAETEEEATSEDSTDDKVESRTTSFPPTNDAHIQRGKGYNQNIIRLEENHRTSYLMFNLSPIDSISGTITGATLQFTINSDGGSGTVNVSKGKSNDWTEKDLSDTTAPEIDIQLGSIVKEYHVGVTEIVELNASDMLPETTTLILDHKDGNDLAFASKEHISKIGPKLVVTYSVPEGSEDIVIQAEEDTTEEDVNKEPIAVADATPPTGGVPLEVTFTGSNSSDNSKISSYSWDFKDGSNATTANTTHTFTKVGTYEVELTVKDDEGLSNTDTVTITVNEDKNQAPKAIASATPLSGEAPLEVSFKGSDSTDDNTVSSYIWDFKDGVSASEANPKHTFTAAGTYVVELTVKDENGLTDKKTVSITVTEPKNEAPKAVATANPSSGQAPLEVQFIGDKSTDDDKVTGYAWDFKDGATATNANPSHSFTEAGSYEVELTVKDKEGLSHKKTVTITVTAPQVQNEPPVAVVSANPTSGQASLEVQFLGNSSTDDDAITSYFWDFKDGATATNANPSHTFTDAGTYVVELTVKDSEGESNTKSITITVEAPSSNDGGGNAPPGYYVTTSGKSSNNGTSEAQAWSLEHAFFTAKAGDIIYVKAGNYGKKELLSRNPGSSGNPIKFIGYKNTPGDVVSNQGSTFNYGESVNASKMPLLQSSNGQGKAITLHDRFIEIENFQITGYSHGIETISRATNIVLRNIVITKVGNQSNRNSYTGFGFNIEGNSTLLENCFVLNAGAEALKLFDSDNSRVNYCQVFADNPNNPTDYYFLLTGGTNNTKIENSYAERAQYLEHGGHGFDMKDLAENNTFRNCTAKRTNFELNFSGVRYNTIEDCSIYGVDTSPSNWHAVMAIFNGANNNLIKNMYIQDTWTAISWADYDDGYVGPGGDRDQVSMGYDNTFDNITIKNTNRILNVGGGTNFNAWAKRNKFINCDFSDFNSVAVTYYPTEDILFKNCKFKNGNKLVIEAGGQYAPYSRFDVTWQNCTWTNVNFTPPN
ncbi:Cytochrome c551/c552 [hydrothermal vent metagenome]|uniref:Cytochrome c551/c552 n=1 Tax=hydrothermal vent metagenome TaxID=652676 RepID=A0A3B0TIF5_9ZZZZ